MANRSWLTWTLLSGATFLLLGPGPASAQLECGAVPSLARQYLKNHVKQRLLTPEIEERAIETFIGRIDPSHTLLLASEVEKIRGDLVGIFNRMREGDCSQLLDLHREIHKRQKSVNAFVEETLGKDDYTLDESVEIVIDPDERGYTATDEERLGLNLKLVHFQISNYLSAGETLEKAKSLLQRKYERRVSRYDDIETRTSWRTSSTPSPCPSTRTPTTSPPTISKTSASRSRSRSRASAWPSPRRTATPPSTG